MRKLFLCILFLNVFYAKGQYQHSISLNTQPYAHHANKEKEFWFPKEFFFPRLSYKIAKLQHGIEVYINFNHASYLQPHTYRSLNEGDITSSFFRIVGLNYHYTILSFKEVEINPFAGINIGVYEEEYVFHVFPQSDAIFDSKKETPIGLQCGLNITVPVWKGFYTNSNFRYTLNPWVEYRYFRYNMVVEWGLGYRIKKKK